MKKRIIALLLAATMVFSIAGCGGSGKEMKVSDKYITVTESLDWGPAITKIILNVGTTADAATLSADSFSVSSRRQYEGLDWTTFETGEQDVVAERKVTNAYVSDEKGNPDPAGTYITLEMQVGPNMTEGSPLNYDFQSGLNSYVVTSYIVEAKNGVKDTNGKEIKFSLDGKAEGQNINLLADDFDRTGSFSANDQTLLYASYVPETATEAGSTPLVIWLHGAGEGGTDTRINIMGNKVVNLATEDIQKYFGTTGAEILAPQTPTMWMNDGNGGYLDPAGTNGRSIYTDTLKGLIDEYISKHPEVDTKRVYIGGCSNGGFMTVNMVAEFPGFFAAAYPVCEAYAVNWLDDTKIANLAATPMWLTAAKNDSTVAIYKGNLGPDYQTYYLEYDEEGNEIPLDDYTPGLYSRIQAAGAVDAHMSIFEDVHDTTGNYFMEGTQMPYQYMGHWSWIYVLNNEVEEDGLTIFEWLSQQSL